MLPTQFYIIDPQPMNRHDLAYHAIINLYDLIIDYLDAKNFKSTSEITDSQWINMVQQTIQLKKELDQFYTTWIKWKPPIEQNIDQLIDKALELHREMFLE